MGALSRFFVQQPLHILGVAGSCVLVWAVLRFGKIAAVPRANALLLPAAAWLAYALREWLVLDKTPETNIRVDLLIIWPVMLVFTVWSVFEAWRSRTSTKRP